MANTDDDTVIYLDPKRSKELSLCQSYGDASAGYGAFNDLYEAWENAVRLFAITDLQVSDRAYTYFDKTRFKKHGLDDFQAWSDIFDKSVSKALEAGIWSGSINYRGRGYRALHKALFLNDASAMMEHPSKYKVFETCLLVYGLIGYIAIQRINRWLRDTEMKPYSLALKEFEDIRSEEGIDQPKFGIDTTTEDAQKALDWLVKHRGFYELCSKNLIQVVCEVGIFASPITKYSRCPDAPEIPDELHERIPILYKFIDEKKLYAEFLHEGQVIEVDRSPLRLYSLYSRKHYLGIPTALHYSVGLDERQTTINLDVDDVVTHLGTAEEYLQTVDRKDLEYKFSKCAAIMRVEHRRQWEERLRDLEDLDEAWHFIDDKIHSIGFVETGDPSEEDVVGDQLAKLMTLPARIEPWITMAEGGPIQQLEAYLYQATNGEEIPSESQPTQAEPSNDLATRLASAIKKVSESRGANGCNIKDVATVLFGDKNDRASDYLKRHFVSTFEDTRYARPAATKKVNGEDKKQEWPYYNENTRRGKSTTSTSIKYQEFVKLWPKESLKIVEWETKDPDDKDGEITSFEVVQLKSNIIRYANPKKVADWLVANFCNEWVEEELSKFELS